MFQGMGSQLAQIYIDRLRCGLRLGRWTSGMGKEQERRVDRMRGGALRYSAGVVSIFRCFAHLFLTPLQIRACTAL